MTQSELADRLNYSDKAVSKWERAESVPDVAVLKQIADLFGVTLDELVREVADRDAVVEKRDDHKLRNHALITGMGILLVWLIATVGFVSADIAVIESGRHFLAFIYAVPVSMIVWLVFNSIWFHPHRNFLIVSLLMWSVLASVFLTFGMYGKWLWQILLLGIPGQIIILFWSHLKYGKKEEKKGNG